MGDAIKKIESLTKLNGVITELPRGGYLIDTSEGYIQFGAPPETLKDTKLLPKGVPTYFILPHDHFHPTQGISMAEVEFPVYFNFFIRKKKTKVFVNPNHAENMKTVLQEAAFGPENVNIKPEVEKVEGYFVPDIKAEMEYFRAGNVLSNMIDIVPIDSHTFNIGKVRIDCRDDKGFDVYENDKLIASVPCQMKFKVLYELGTKLKEPFEPPEFGITCLGPSHGFDHQENTSGFIIWINKTGVMVDPPVNSTAWLKDSNVNPKLIDTVILTHCHADHDSGTFQKILEEERIKIYTTPTILQSFLKKYSALTRMSASTLINLFDFCPVKLNQQFNIHGAMFNFYYSLHSIPTIAFHLSYRDKTFLYSSDHLNDPKRINDMFEKGVISVDRKDFLLNFPWESDIIYHEAGVPPLHTSIGYLNSLPEEIQEKVTVYHIAASDFPEKTKLKLAKFGIGETLYPKIEKHRYEDAYRILDVFSRIEIFKDLPPMKLKDLLLIVGEEHFQKGDSIIEKGTEGDKFYVIVSGNVSIGGLEETVEDKVYGTYEYFGEASLLFGGLRTADVFARTSVFAYSIRKDAFLRLIRHTEVENHIRQLAEVRNGRSWKVIKANRYFKHLSSSQVTQLESIMSPVIVDKEKYLFYSDDDRAHVFLLESGQIYETKDGEPFKVLEMGDFLRDRFDFEEEIDYDKNFYCSTETHLFKMSKKDYEHFLADNPGIKMNIMYKNRK